MGVERYVLRGWYREGKAEGEIATRGGTIVGAYVARKRNFQIEPRATSILRFSPFETGPRAHQLTNLPRERTRPEATVGRASVVRGAEWLGLSW